MVLLLFNCKSWARNSGESDKDSSRTLTLEQISRLALNNSLDIQIARISSLIAKTGLEKELSLFDFFLNSGLSLRNDEKKTSSSLLGSRTDTKIYSLDLDKRLSSGTGLRIKAAEQRTSTDSALSSASPEKQAELGLSITQPLARNFFGFSDRAGIKITRLDIKQAEYASVNDIESSLADTQKAYWNLVLKKQELLIKKSLLTEAERLHSVYRENFKLGLVETGDLYATEANLRIKENEVIQAELFADTAKNDLLFLINITDIKTELEPEDNLELVPLSADLLQALNKAIRSRRDYQQALLNAESQKIKLAVAKNALWPEIDLTASFTRNGIDPRRSEAWDQIKDENNDELYLGLNFSTALEKRKEKAELKKAGLKKKQALLSVKKTEQLILKDICNRVRETNSLKSKIELFEQVADLQEKKLAEEMKKLKYGRSGADIVIRYENDLLQSRLDLARAYFDFRVSLIDLDLTQNTLLDRYLDE